MRPLQVYKFMSVCTQSVGRDQPLASAHRRMREHHIRHLPVLDGGVLVGVVTDRDLRFIETLREVDPEKVLVEEAMTAEPYFVPPNASVRDVATEMAKHKYGCAVVMDGPKVVGIFTTTDALRALVEVLETPIDGPMPAQSPEITRNSTARANARGALAHRTRRD